MTDANVVLGRLDPEVRLGGAMRLRADLASAAVRGLADELGLDVLACAEGIVRVTDTQMAKALRVVSVEKGHDPRRLALVPFGGAGPLHQAALAAELGCPQVLVPPNPGVLSALGLLAAPVTVDRARTRLTAGSDLDAHQLAEGWAELESEARAALDEQGVEVAAVRRTADVRYRGQAFELEVAEPAAPAANDGAITDPNALITAFHDAHLDRYGYDQRDEEVELVTLRCRAEGPAPELPLPPLGGGGDADAAELTRRQVTVSGEAITARVFDRGRLGAGARLQGPAVVVGLDATVWVAPWQGGEVDDLGVLVLTERETGLAP